MVLFWFDPTEATDDDGQEDRTFFFVVDADCIVELELALSTLGPIFVHEHNHHLAISRISLNTLPGPFSELHIHTSESRQATSLQKLIQLARQGSRRAHTVTQENLLKFF